MKLRKRFGIGALAAAMVMGLFAPAAANAAGNPSLPPDKGTLIIHKYMLEDMSEAISYHQTDFDGKELTAAQIPSTAVPLDEIEFEIFKLNVQYDSHGNLTGTYPEKATQVDVTDPAQLDAAFSSPKTVKTGTDADTVNGFTVETGVASVELPKGIYYVREKSSTLVSSPCAPFLVAVPMTDPKDKDNWMTAVHVYPKNQNLDIAKSVEDAGNLHHTASTLKSFPWLVDVPVPADIYVGDSTDSVIAASDTKIKYTITDILDSQLEYVTTVADEDTTKAITEYASPVAASETDLTPYLIATTAINGTMDTGKGAGGVIPQTHPTEGVLYTVTHTAVSNTLVLELTTAGRKYLKDEGILSMRWVFFTKISEATASVNVPIPNEDIKLDYTNNYDEAKEYELDPDEIPEVHTGELTFTKVDKNDTNMVLVGGEFKLALTEADALAEKYITDRNGNDIVAVSDADGKVTFTGLAYGQTGDDVDEANGGQMSYWVVEVKAPTWTDPLDSTKIYKYKLLDKPVELPIVIETDGNGDVTNIVDADQVVYNTKDFELPITGGMGTALFTIGGIVLIGAAVILMIATKKRKVNA